jgi:uncharacterized protein DUF3999
VTRRARRIAAVVVAAFALIALARRGGASDGATARSLAVERAGTVRVALPAATFPATTGFEVVGPDGARVASRLVTLESGAATRRARVVAVSESPRGWWVVVDAGASPPHHQGVRLPLAAAGLVEVHVESSADRRAWTPLADAALFRLGTDSELQGSAVTYPATDARYLRLEWPSAAKFPRVETVELDTVAQGVEEVELPANACAADGARTVCDLGALTHRAVESVLVTLPADR